MGPDLDLGSPSRLRWAPGERSRIAWARDPKGRRGFHRIDLETGSYSMLVRGEELGIVPRSGHFDISADGRTLWFARRDAVSAESPLTLVAYDLTEGTSRSVAPIEATDEGFVSVSPDGERLAIVAPGSPCGTISTIPVIARSAQRISGSMEIKIGRNMLMTVYPRTPDTAPA